MPVLVNLLPKTYFVDSRYSDNGVFEYPHFPHSIGLSGVLFLQTVHSLNGDIVLVVTRVDRPSTKSAGVNVSQTEYQSPHPRSTSPERHLDVEGIANKQRIGQNWSTQENTTQCDQNSRRCDHCFGVYAVRLAGIRRLNGGVEWCGHVKGNSLIILPWFKAVKVDLSWNDHKRTQN